MWSWICFCSIQMKTFQHKRWWDHCRCWRLWKQVDIIRKTPSGDELFFRRFFWLQQLQKARRLYTHSNSVASSKSTVNCIKILLTFYNLCIRLDYWKKTQRTLRQRSPVHLRTFCQQWRGLLNLLPHNLLTILGKSLSFKILAARPGGCYNNSCPPLTSLHPYSVSSWWEVRLTRPPPPGVRLRRAPPPTTRASRRSPR